MAAEGMTHSRELLKERADIPQKKKALSPTACVGQDIEGSYMAFLIPVRMSHQFMGYAVMKPQSMLSCIISQKTG